MLVSFSVSRIFLSSSVISIFVAGLNVYGKLEYRVLGLLVLAKLRPDASQKHRKFERLCYVVVRPCVETKDRVSIAVVTGQHQDRAFDALLAHDPAKLSTIGVRQTHIEYHQIVNRFLGTAQRILAIARFENVEVFGHDQLLAQRFAQVLIVINQQDFFNLSHWVFLCVSCR